MTNRVTRTMGPDWGTGRVAQAAQGLALGHQHMLLCIHMYAKIVKISVLQFSHNHPQNLVTPKTSKNLCSAPFGDKNNFSDEIQSDYTSLMIKNLQYKMCIFSLNLYAWLAGFQTEMENSIFCIFFLDVFTYAISKSSYSFYSYGQSKVLLSIA